MRINAIKKTCTSSLYKVGACGRRELRASLLTAKLITWAQMIWKTFTVCNRSKVVVTYIFTGSFVIWKIKERFEIFCRQVMSVER